MSKTILNMFSGIPLEIRLHHLEIHLESITRVSVNFKSSFNHLEAFSTATRRSYRFNLEMIKNKLFNELRNVFSKITQIFIKIDKNPKIPQESL